MNLFLHNIGDIDSDNNISPADALIAPTDVRYDYVLANSPFGKKSSQTLYQRRRGTGKRRPHLQPPELLGNHQQQATELRSAHPLHAKVGRHGSSGLFRTMCCIV
jgi:type I restriction-modification system DNA methylase subunit